MEARGRGGEKVRLLGGWAKLSCPRQARSLSSLLLSDVSVDQRESLSYETAIVLKLSPFLFLVPE